MRGPSRSTSPRSGSRRTTEVERLHLPHLDRSDIERDVAVLADDSFDLARSDRDRDSLGARPARKPGRDDAHAVAGELGDRAVGIPDADLGLRTVGGHDLEEAVRTDAVVVVAQLRNGVRRQRLGEVSLLDQQVIVAQRLPLRQFHVRSRPRDDRR